LGKREFKKEDYINSETLVAEYALDEAERRKKKPKENPLNLVFGTLCFGW
jgi:hypothetical protein